jgi:hypothetical protein
LFNQGKLPEADVDVVDDSELQIEMEFGGMLNDLKSSDESELQQKIIERII